MDRRNLLAAALLAVSAQLPAAAQTVESAWSGLGTAGIVLFRHAEAPGVGDPANFKLDDCSTQRNLSEQGRAQARRMGEQFRARGVPVAAVLTSQWCRTRDTAALAFPGLVRDEPAFNSFFGEPASNAPQTAAARARLAAWRGPGVLVVVTHQVNITALTGVYPASGEGVVVRPRADGGLDVVGRLQP
ncbi:histidine phosphatase family protein [Pseudorhodoferax sp. Leaf267]|uniref:histidine phosphatase family protein n=1 Tax=Pseudorhodoferax sp. Leaf267 TaxID=1736316 RepID=UPI0006F55F18|nr:histidine phosphatase family protein [Pseudorhodoferax sp. Leaf267]KQP12226.1 phosphoglycerate mutase [Pseudorhodoferax sp. Leaf267]